VIRATEPTIYSLGPSAHTQDTMAIRPYSAA